MLYRPVRYFNHPHQDKLGKLHAGVISIGLSGVCGPFSADDSYAQIEDHNAEDMNDSDNDPLINSARIIAHRSLAVHADIKFMCSSIETYVKDMEAQSVPNT